MNESNFSRVLNLSKRNSSNNTRESPEKDKGRNHTLMTPEKSLQSNYESPLVRLNSLGNQSVDSVSGTTVMSHTSKPASKFSARTNLFDSPKKPRNNIYNSKIGFENLGNTCYLNTSLHCLIHSTYFTSEFFKTFEQSSDTNKETVSYELFRLMKDIRLMSENETCKPKTFLTEFSEKHKKFQGFVQHDAQEFLRILLEDISNDLNKVKEKPVYKELSLKNKGKVASNTAFNEHFKERENSIIVELFYGQICNIFACELCNYKTYSFEKIMDIPILLEEVRIYDLYELLNIYFQDDVIQWDKKCDSRSCNFRGNHIKSSRISILPKILVITFQRYNYRSKRKNSSKICFEQKIDIAKFVDLDCVGLEKVSNY